MGSDKNRDENVISHFGGEWKAFNYLDSERLEDVREQFNSYVRPLPQGFLTRKDLVIADFGAGSGRWAHFFLDSAKQVYMLEPGVESFALLRQRFATSPKAVLLNETVSDNSVPDSSLDLAVSLGVLHHIPSTLKGIQDISKKIKPGGYFLCYLYYALENKPFAYRLLWKFSNLFRLAISKLPFIARRAVCEIIAGIFYFPLARVSKAVEKLGMSTGNIPLHHYAQMSYYVMRNDAYDRFGTSLEQRFTRSEITEMLIQSGFDMSTLTFSKDEPFWTFSIRNP